MKNISDDLRLGDARKLLRDGILTYRGKTVDVTWIADWIEDLLDERAKLRVASSTHPDARGRRLWALESGGKIATNFEGTPLLFRYKTDAVSLAVPGQRPVRVTVYVVRAP